MGEYPQLQDHLARIQRADRPDRHTARLAEVAVHRRAARRLWVGVAVQVVWER